MILWDAFIVFFLLPLAMVLGVRLFLKGCAALNWCLDATIRHQRGFWATVADA